MRAREKAIHACGAACEDLGLQLLDQTVVLHSWRLRRGADGRLAVQRVYLFEYSADGVGRCTGHTVLLGAKVEYVHLDHCGRSIILERHGGLKCRGH